MAEITIYTIAKELNMTPSMVSRAFNPACKVSKEKRRLILETAKRYNFSPNKMASRLSMKNVRIGILINSRFDVNTEKMLSGVSRAFERLKDYKVDYDVIVVNPHKERDFDYDKTLSELAEYDGVIVTGLSAERYSQSLQRLYEKNSNLVQVQSVNGGSDYLFASKHNEQTASFLACEFLCNCLRKSERKNVLLFIGDKESELHKSAASAFEKACVKMGLTLLDTIEFGDSEEQLSRITAEAFEKYDGAVDGVYTTSGISEALCRYLDENKVDAAFVAFDTHEAVRRYMKKGVVCAAIDQNVTQQMACAFEGLVKHIISGESCEKVIYTDVQLVLESNIYQFD